MHVVGYLSFIRIDLTLVLGVREEVVPRNAVLSLARARHATEEVGGRIRKLDEARSCCDSILSGS